MYTHFHMDFVDEILFSLLKMYISLQNLQVTMKILFLRMAKNSRMSKLSEKEDECVFSWKLFTGWDFMIGNAETAHNRIGSIVLGLKEALLEESEKHRDERKCVTFKN